PYFKRFDELAKNLIDNTSSVKHWSEQDRKLLWGSWFNREKEFYLLCAQKILEKKDQLFEIACSTPILEPEQYEARFRDSLSSELKEELDEEIPAGTFVPIETLWYRLNLAHRNLWRLPDSKQNF